MNTNTATMIILVIIALVIFMPLAVIWSLNTLFGMGIAYTFTNWVAMVILTTTFGKANVKVNKDK